MEDYTDHRLLSKRHILDLSKMYNVAIPTSRSRMALHRDFVNFKAHTIVYTHKVANEQAMLSKMPPEIIRCMLRILPPRDRKAFGCVSKTMHSIYQSTLKKEEPKSVDMALRPQQRKRKRTMTTSPANAPARYREHVNPYELLK